MWTGPLIPKPAQSSSMSDAEHKCRKCGAVTVAQVSCRVCGVGFPESVPGSAARSQSLMKHLKAGVMSIAVVCLCFVGYVISELQPTVKHHVSDWDSFYAENLQPRIKIPPEAAIVDAWEVTSFPMGYTITVNFRLPPTKTPEGWVKSIAKASQTDFEIGPGFWRPRSTYKMERHDGSYISVEYLPDSELYEVHYDWD